MADTPIDERLFTDQEIREILKLAVEKAPSRELIARDGLSLAELKTIGAEVGIDPARMEDAARTVTFAQANRPNRLVGAPTILNFERKVAGELAPDDTPDVLALIRQTMGVQGEAVEIHGSLEWRAMGELGERSVTISSRDGATTIRSAANLSNAATLTYLPAGVVGAITSILGLITFAKKGSDIGLIVFLAVLPALYPILRTVFSKISRSESAKLQRVVEELASLTRGPGG